MKIQNLKNINLKKLKRPIIFALAISASVTGCKIQHKKHEQFNFTDYTAPTTSIQIQPTTEEIDIIETATASVYPEHYIEPIIEEDSNIIQPTTKEIDIIEITTTSVYPEHYIEPITEEDSNIIQPTTEEIDIIETATASVYPEHYIEPTTEKTLPKVVDERKVIALTFDDGPSKYTSELVKILEENNASATFFLVGRSIKNYSSSVKEAYLAGNEIAIHTYTHTSFKKMTIVEILDEINRTRALIEEIGVEYSNLVRPPYGSITNEIVESIDTSFILWNIDTRDWESRDKEAIKQEVAKAIKEGSIMLFHDTYPETIEAIREILPMYSDEYRFITVSELFETYEQELEENKKYYKVKR